jgi:hypothetical protein
MGSGAMLYIPSFVKVGSKVEPGGGDLQTHRQHGDLISLLLCFQTKGSRIIKRDNSVGINNIVVIFYSVRITSLQV